MPTPPLLRPGRPADADALTAVFLRSRAAAMPWLVSPHGPDATRWWVEHVVLDLQETRVAERDGVPVGFAVLVGDWLEQLYVDPDAQGAGVGRALLEAAKADRPGGLRLHVFTRNTAARRFYAAAGFVDAGAGGADEESEPDLVLAWPAA